MLCHASIRGCCPARISLKKQMRLPVVIRAYGIAWIYTRSVPALAATGSCSSELLQYTGSRCFYHNFVRRQRPRLFSPRKGSAQPDFNTVQKILQGLYTAVTRSRTILPMISPWVVWSASALIRSQSAEKSSTAIMRTG